MSVLFYEKGDTVGYPNWNDTRGKTMTVSDRQIYAHASRKIYVRYLFDELLDKLVEEMHENVKNDLDNVVCVWGSEGSGKSNLAYWLCKKYDPNFNIEESYTYSFDDLLKRIHDCNRQDEGMVFWMDEATNIANNRDWMHRDNKTFLTMLEMFRSRKWTLVLCIPDYNRLDVTLRERRIRYSLHADYLDWEGRPKSRGYFQLTRIDSTNGDFRRTQSPGYGSFERIPPEERETYERIKTQTQDTKLDEIYNEKNRKTRMTEVAAVNRKLLLELHDNRNVSIEELSEMTGFTPGTVRVYLINARKEREGEK